MDKLVICYIQAYNSTQTIEATMRSVHEQTYQNWRCFVLCNGEKPITGAFDKMRNYAAQDNRFVVLYREKNWIGCYLRMLLQLASMYPDAYICVLDGDDEYEPDFFERAVALAEKERLDVVACGTKLILRKYPGEPGGTVIRERSMEQNLILDGENSVRLFPRYRSYFNEVWGKMYNAHVLKVKHIDQYVNSHYKAVFLPDTLFVLDVLFRSDSIGILSGTSHRFYQFEHRPLDNGTVAVNSLVHKAFSPWRDWPVVRWMTGGIPYNLYFTYDRTMEFLRARGEVDAETYEYMQAVLFGWFEDAYYRSFMQLPTDVSLAGVAGKLVFHPKFDELMCYRDSGKFDNLRNYEARERYCRKLRDLLGCQMGLNKRNVLFLHNLKTDANTRRRLEKTMLKLEQTAEKLKRLQVEGGNYVK